ncbi:MAG: hypothetical protein JEZ09_16745 [Salinivirgaceae bacterium]|nr:hypothetical protein [Salinivirgaceae bacterium]
MEKYLITLLLKGIIISLFFTVNIAFVVPAHLTPRLYTMSDGTSITLIVTGDEKVNWIETIDGYTLLADGKGYYNNTIQPTTNNLIILL